MIIKHKKRFVMVAVSCVLVLAIGISLAYLTANKAVDNTVTIGTNEIEISEDFSPPTAQTTDTKYKKQISVTNTGDVSCYVRVYADFSDETIRNISYFSNSSKDLDKLTIADFKSAKRDATGYNNYVNESNLPDGWVFVPDNDPSDLAGYYYYTKPLAPGATTETSLFTYIWTRYASENAIVQYDVIVYAESVQTTDSYGEAYENYTAAWTDFLKDPTTT